MLNILLCAAALSSPVQQAGPTGVKKAGDPTEVKTLADVYALSERAPLPESLKRVVLITYRAPDGAGASRLETLIGPQRIRVKISDLEGMNLLMCATADEVWVVNNQAREFLRKSLKEVPVTTELLQDAIFKQLNAGAAKNAEKDDQIGMKMQFGPSGMPTVSFPTELALHDKTDTKDGVEYLFTGSRNKNDIAATVTTDKAGRVQKAIFDFVVGDGFSASVTLETISYSTEAVAKSEFDFPEAMAKGYTQKEVDAGGN